MNLTSPEHLARSLRAAPEPVAAERAREYALGHHPDVTSKLDDPDWVRVFVLLASHGESVCRVLRQDPSVVDEVLRADAPPRTPRAELHELLALHVEVAFEAFELGRTELWQLVEDLVALKRDLAHALEGGDVVAKLSSNACRKAGTNRVLKL